MYVIAITKLRKTRYLLLYDDKEEDLNFKFEGKEFDQEDSFKYQ